MPPNPEGIDEVQRGLHRTRATRARHSLTQSQLLLILITMMMTMTPTHDMRWGLDERSKRGCQPRQWHGRPQSSSLRKMAWKR